MTRRFGLLWLALGAVSACGSPAWVTPGDGAAAASGGAGMLEPAGSSATATSGRGSGPGAGVAAIAGKGGAGASGMAGTSGAGAAGTTDAAGATAGTAGAQDLIAAADGQDMAAGTIDHPTTLTAAITRVAAGHAILLRGGKYTFSMQITIARDNSGADAQPKRIAPYQSEKPILDFSSQPYAKDGNPRGLQIDGSYWHVQGLEVTGSADNGIYVAGNHNIIEGCIVHGNRDTGLQLGRYMSSAEFADWPADNLILNCESYDNYDVAPGSGENADGFAAKLTVGPGNVFRGCVSHHNIDDGWDLYTKSATGAIGPVTIDQCIAHHNGTLTNGTSNANGDRNGFKLGGEDIEVAHVVTRSVAFANGKDGFTWNSNPGAIRLSNCLAFDNADGNYRFGDSSTTTKAVFTNNVSFWTSTSGAQSDKTVGSDVANSNCFWTTSGAQPSQNGKGLIVSAADFATSLQNPTITRAADGTLELTAFKLASGSDLINAGVLPAGMLPFATSYYKDAPDLGAFESP